MTNAHPPLTASLIDAFAASAVLWLTRLLSVLLAPSAAGRARRLRRFVNYIERVVECVIFLKAVHAFGPPPQAPRRHPRFAPAGFRRVRAGRRLLWKSARIRARGAGLVDRVVRLFEALTHSAIYIARFTRRLMRGLRAASLAPSAPPAITHASDATFAVAFADSS